VTLSPPDDHENGKREVEIADAGAADVAFQQLKPLLRPDKAQDAKLVLTRMVSKSHRGPIPSAEELEHLEQVLPGSANRCFEMAEREQAHRHTVEKTIVDREFTLRGRGQWLAIAGLILLLLVVGYLASEGDTVSAAALGSATIIGVVAIFVTGRRYDAKENGGSSKPDPEPEPESKEEQKQVPRSERRNRQFGRS
jgi:uncharacterized membrane protein